MRPSRCEQRARASYTWSGPRGCCGCRAMEANGRVNCTYRERAGGSGVITLAAARSAPGEW
eukprot:4765994-Prymnesium_polylepis.2